MSRTPIIIPGQVYLHPSNEYITVTKSNQGLITFKGDGISGMHDVDIFLERCGPVDPEDLDDSETTELLVFLNEGAKLSTGWIILDGDDEDWDE